MPSPRDRKISIGAFHAQQAEAHEQRLAHAQPVEGSGKPDGVEGDRIPEKQPRGPHEDEKRRHEQRERRKGGGDPPRPSERRPFELRPT